MRILLAGESTAGHMAPMIAVYEALKKKTDQNPSKAAEFMLISTDSDFLKAFVHDTDIKYKSLGEQGEYKESSIRTSLSIFSKVLYIVFDYMPDVIFVKSGFISLPVAIAGKLFGIPVVAHEADIFPTKLDLWISKFSKRVAISFNKSAEFYDKNKVFFSGNPVSSHISSGSREEGRKKFMIESDRPVVLIMAGSKGARQINGLVAEILPTLLQKYEIIHQCGIGNYEEVRAKVEQMNIPFLNSYHLFPFLKKSMADAYAAADLIVSRAGANTVAEIILVGKPSILIPLSVSEGDRQVKNAYYYSEAGAALMLNEKNLKPNLFLNAISGIFENKLKIMEMMRSARKLARPEAADVIAEEIIKVSL